jgi:phosphoserine phosphatase RsbU/P
MLADVLESKRDQVEHDLEYLEASTEWSVLPISDRRKRLDWFVGDLIGALRRGWVDDATQPLAQAAPGLDPVLELRERELVRDYVIKEVEQRHLDASPSESAIVADWVAKVDRDRLREENRRLRALLDGVQESAALIAPDGRILYANRMALRHLRTRIGVPIGEIIGRTPAEMGVPGELVVGRSIAELVPLARAHESVATTAWGRAYEEKFDAVYESDGTVSAVAMIVRDVHSRKLAETRMELLTKLAALPAMVEYDEVAKALVEVPIPEFADWCAITNIENNRIIGRTFLAHRDPNAAALRDVILHAQPAWDRHPLWQEMLTHGFQLLTEVSDDLLRRLTGDDRQYRVMSKLGIRSAMVVPLVSRGQIKGIMTLAYTKQSGRRYGRDDPPMAEELALHVARTFETARLMKDLMASEARFRVAIAGARTIVYEQDLSLRYVWYYNPVVPVNLLGKTHEEALPPDEAAMLTAAKRHVLEVGEGMREEMDFTFGGKELRHYREAIEPLRDHTGKIVGVIGAATDITEQQRTLKRLAEALDFRERMMGILSHDLRNPLNAVIMTADLLLGPKDLPPATRNQLLRLRRAAGRMQEMIGKLLDFTSARFMGKIPVSRVPADLGDVARAAFDEVNVLCPGQALNLDVRGDTRGEWDPSRMSQTLINLVTNAVAYGQSGTAVQITVDGEGRDDVVVKVHNRGPAMSADLIAELFEPFHRGVPQDRSPAGLGLGLYIVKQIVLAHDGKVDVESTDKEGTTFTLRLPRQRRPAVAPG